MPGGKEDLFSARGSLWRLAVPGESLPARLPFVGEDGLMPVVSGPQPGRPSRLVYVRSLADSNIWRIETSAPGAGASSTPVVSISSTRVDYNAQFSPDGQTIAFHSNPDGQLQIYVVPASGGKPRRLTSHAANDRVPSSSREGHWIYFSSNRTGENQIRKIPATGGDAVQVTRNVGFVALEAPDGAYVYYTQTSGAPSALWRLPTSGGQPVKVLEGLVSWAFVVLEKGIYYIDRPAGEARLEFFDFATGRSTTVARNLGEIGLGLTASLDGRTILYTRVDSSVDDLMLVENFR